MREDLGWLTDTWAGIVAGWADHLDPSGANLLIDGIHNRADSNGSYEGTTRMLWGIGGWLSSPTRPGTVVWRDRSYDLEHLMRRAIVNGTNPDDPGYWGDPVQSGAAQYTVESGQVAYAIWQTRHRVWDGLTPDERRRVADWLMVCGHPPESRWGNNWALFWALNHAVRDALGLPCDIDLVDDVMKRYLDDVYCGNGWYDDGPARGTNHFDDYNLWVFASHVLAWIDVDDGRTPHRAAKLLDRIRALMQHVPSFFAADGAYPEYGRSGAYKFARLGALLWAHRHGAWPHSVGLLRTIVERHLRWYLRRGAIRPDGTLRQALTSTGSPAIRESYISTGASYWATQAFGGLWSLPDDDPLWTTAPEPLPIERGDVHRVLMEPGWILTGTRESGHIHRFTTYVSHYPAKYAKLAYSTAAPYNAGLGDGAPTPDAMISLHLDGRTSHRVVNEMEAIHPDGWIRYRHAHELDGTRAVFDTIVVPIGDLHLRLHRLVNASSESVPTIEGAAALGFDDGDTPGLIADHDHAISAGTVADRAVGIRCWDGLRRPRLPRSFADGGTGNVVFGRNVIPFLEGVLTVGDVVVSTVFLGTTRQVLERGFPTLLVSRPTVGWRDDDAVDVSWSDRTMTIAWPPAADS